MSLITLPDAFVPTTCSLTLYVNQRVSAAPFGGSEQAIDLMNDRWLYTCELAPRFKSDGGWIEAFIGAMRGQTNTTRIHHFARPQPTGTLRGNLLLNAAVAQGARSLVLKGCNPANGTLKHGDLLGVTGLLLMVAADCTAVAGVITVPLTNAVRKTLSLNAAVAWDRPAMIARLLDTSGVAYEPGLTQSVSFNFGEAIS